MAAAARPRRCAEKSVADAFSVIDSKRNGGAAAKIESREEEDGWDGHTGGDDSNEKQNFAAAL